jgi:predicted CopG family antitoxin
MSVYAKCMAVKTITIDLDAYERLSRLKNGDSFSQVIKKYLPAAGSTAGDLLDALDDVALSEETVDAIDAAVQDRRNHAVRVPNW